MAAWEPAAPGVLTLPSGLCVRGRGLRTAVDSKPEFSLVLLGRRPQPFGWPVRWVRWPDFWLPLDRDDARKALHRAYARAVTDRVEVVCGGGRGRTGTALACLAVLDGVLPGKAVAYVRRHYDPRAVETPWQRRYVEQFG